MAQYIIVRNGFILGRRTLSKKSVEILLGRSRGKVRADFQVMEVHETPLVKQVSKTVMKVAN